MPKGLIYEGVQPEPMEYSGGSAAQSSLLHCFDELLGIKHEAKSGKTADFFQPFDSLQHQRGMRTTHCDETALMQVPF